MAIFAAGASMILGQQATAAKSNEKTAIPELLATLALEGSIVTIDAMGTQPSVAQTIRNRGANYILSVKDNQPTLAESMEDFFATFQAAPGKTPLEQRFYISSLPADAALLNRSIRQHWRVENSDEATHLE